MFGDLNPKQTEQLVRVIESVSNQQTAEALDAMSNWIAAGAIKSPERLDELYGKNPHVPPAVLEQTTRDVFQRDALSKRLDRETNETTTAVNPGTALQV